MCLPYTSGLQLKRSGSYSGGRFRTETVTDNPHSSDIETAREAARRHGSARFLEMLEAELDSDVAAELQEEADDHREVVRELTPGVAIVWDKSADASPPPGSGPV